MQKVAIYSRKSKFTGKGDSIENQIEMCKYYISNYIKKNVEFIIYEDEGFSGSTTNRPQFKQLMNDITQEKINYLVCYRLDRISRNVADFSSTLETLQSYNVNFISIKEQFDTSTPMGRAMIYIASVFAQLERETIAERVKDNMVELAKNGKWTGGKIPLGFTSKKIKHTDDTGLEREIPTLEINETEMEFVKFLYNKYLELGSLHKLEVYITMNGLKSRNNILFEKSSLKIILQNPIYVKATNEIKQYLETSCCIVYGYIDNEHSLLTYNKTEQTMKNGKYTKTKKAPGEMFAAVSNIQGALEPELWLKVQHQFEENKNKFPRLGKTHNALLIGKLRCGNCKEYMLIHHGKISKTTGEKLFYYICSLKRKSHSSLCDNTNAKLSDIENLTLSSLKVLAKSKSEFINSLNEKYKADTKNNINDEKLSLNKLLTERKKQISNLLTEFSKEEDEYMKELIREKILPLKNDCIKIENRLAQLENEKQKSKTDKLNLEVIESLLNECEIIDTLPRNRQKQLIDTLIDVIYWYGNKDGLNKISIKFVGTDEDSEEVQYSIENFTHSQLQFGSHSSCKTNDNFLPTRKIEKNTWA
jgi:DNA invertase Pin-like site-specific DNA recombinase